MWQEAKANDRRIKELMSDHKKRAERRRAYYESRLGDPQQLIRVIGSSSKIYPDAEQFYYHENPDNLMPWQGNPDIKIDRFDGRSLLDFVPDTRNQRGYQDVSKEDREMNDELNFERYHDLIEAERLNVTESERLAEVEEEWTKLLDRHQAKLALLKNQEKSNTNTKSRGFGFDYGTSKANEEDLEENDEEESKLLKEVDILQYVDDLTDKDKQALNEMSGKYGIKSYARLLRVAKKDRDEELRSLKRRQEEGKPKEGTRNSRRRSNERRRRRRRRGRDYDQDDESRYRRRYSPTYEPYGQGSDGSGSSMSEDDEDEDDGLPKTDNSDFVIEFGSNAPDEHMPTNQQEDENDTTQKPATPVAPIEKKLTPMEKLKLKMRAGLEKQIVSDEKDKRQKEKAKEIENLQELARSQGLPINTYLRPDPPQRQFTANATAADGKARYRSPSSDGSASPKRSSSPPPKKRARSPSSRSDYNRKYSCSPSSSPTRRRSRSRDRNPSSSSSRRRRSRSIDRKPSTKSSARRRSLSRDKHHHRSSSSRDHRRPRSRSRSPPSSSRRGRYRSPSEDRGHSRKNSRRHSRSRSRSPRRHDRGSSRRQ